MLTRYQILQCVLHITCYILQAIIVFKAYQMEDVTPPWTGLLYYLIVIFAVMWIPVYFFIYTCPNGIWAVSTIYIAWLG